MLMLFSHHLLGIPHGRFPNGSRHQNSVSVCLLVRSLYPAYCNVIEFTMLTILSDLDHEVYIPLPTYFLGPNISLGTFYFQTLFPWERHHV